MVKNSSTSNNLHSIKTRMMRNHITITDMCQTLENRGVRISYNDVQQLYHGQLNDSYAFVVGVLDDVEKNGGEKDGKA